MFLICQENYTQLLWKENTAMKNRKNIKILLRSKLEIGRFFFFFFKDLGEKFGSEKKLFVQM